MLSGVLGVIESISSNIMSISPYSKQEAQMGPPLSPKTFALIEQNDLEVKQKTTTLFPTFKIFVMHFVTVKSKKSYNIPKSSRKANTSHSFNMYS